MDQTADEIADSLTERAEIRRLEALRAHPAEHRERLGQFFTPKLAAQFMAGLVRLRREGRIRVLDPGAGSGALAAAIAARVMRECPAATLEIVAVELDAGIERFLKETLEDITASARQAGVRIDYQLVTGDFIELYANGEESREFDVVIMNPPYRKLGVTSAYRKSLLKLGVDCANLYAGFLALGTMSLTDGGQLVAITPRSFTNGPYFNQFRRFLLDRVSLDLIHVFESRSTVFSDTGVLQENIVFSATRGGDRGEVLLSSSRGHTDEPVQRTVDYSEVLEPSDENGFIRLLVADNDTAVAETMAHMPAVLADIGAGVSTGRVVDFRSRECLQPSPLLGSHALIYPGNLRGGVVEWPRAIRKDQGFSVREPKDASLLMPEGYYVVVKRFSAKEERRRVVASVWDPTVHPGAIAFENHLNVFHAKGAGLTRDQAVGLSYWLNSSLVDKFFRTFSGHTQVNATDLRSLRFPPLSVLTTHGKELTAALPSQTEIDSAVASMITSSKAAV